MTVTITTDPGPSRGDRGVDEVATRLVESSIMASRNAMTEIDWTRPLEPDKHGCSPEWSALFGTSYWQELDEGQRIRLTRHEMASIMTIGVWFEMMLQQLVIRDQRSVAAHSPEFRFAMTEIADECRHSLMFSLASQRLVGRAYHPSPKVARMGRVFMNLARGEIAYAGILVAEEILDVLQRGSLGDPRVLPLIQTVNEVHVLEESRHMRFAREQVRASMARASRVRREISAVAVALGAEMVVLSLVRPQAFTDAGLDRRRAIAEMRTNVHRHAMLRGSCVHLMQFLDEVGLLTPAASRVYRRCHLL